MRVKTEDRRQAIIDVATEVFREVGYERASMAQISRRLGGSKGTLYGYFESKEALFETAMKAASEGPGDQIMDLLDPDDDNPRDVLRRFAKAYLAFICSANVLSITRTAIAEGSGSSLGPHLFEGGPGRALARMERYFAVLIARSMLRASSPAVVALHFKGLVETGFHEEALYGARTQSDAIVDDAVDVFLRAYQVPAQTAFAARRRAVTEVARSASRKLV